MTFQARFSPAKAHAIRRLHIDFKLTYKHINKLCPMDKKTFFRIVGCQGAYK